MILPKLTLKIEKTDDGARIVVKVGDTVFEKEISGEQAEALLKAREIEDDGP